MANSTSSFSTSFPHADFKNNPNEYVLVTKNNSIFAERKGIVTWVKAKLSPFISSFGEFRLPKIIDTIKKIETLQPQEQEDLVPINDKIRKYNERNQTDIPLFQALLQEPKQIDIPLTMRQEVNETPLILEQNPEATALFTQICKDGDETLL